MPEPNSVGKFSHLQYVEDASVSEALYDFDQDESTKIFEFVLLQTERVQCCQRMLRALGLIRTHWPLIHRTPRRYMVMDFQCWNKRGFGGQIPYHLMSESISMVQWY